MGECLAFGLKNLKDCFGRGPWVAVAKAQQDETGAALSLPDYKLTEIPVSGKEDTAGTVSQGKHGVIVDPAMCGSDFHDIVPGFAEEFDDAPIDVLIGKDVHATLAGSPNMISSRLR